MYLSIITINYNSSENTIKLLNSLQGQIDKDFSTIVIDNASEEEDLQNLKNYVELTRVTLIEQGENLGFSGGNNVGIRKALENSAEWVLLLNIDTWVGREFIASLKAKLKHLGGIAGIPLVEGDKTAYLGKVRWLKPTLAHIYNPLYAEYLKRNTDYYAIGGAMAIHKDVIEKIGFLDEKYFLYFEDADLSLRVRKAGLPLNFLDEPKVYHQVSATTKKLGSSLLLRYHYRNSLYFNWLRGPWHIKLFVLPWSWWVAVKQLLKIMLMYKHEESLAILSGTFDFYLNKMGRIK